MKKIIYNKWLDVIADYYGGEYPDKDKTLNIAIANAVASIPWKDRHAILTEHMVYRGGIESAKNGDYAIAFYDAYNDLKEVYGDEFNDSVYVKKGGTDDSNDWRYKNGEPYVWSVYCNQIGMALATYYKKEYVAKGKNFTVDDIDD